MEWGVVPVLEVNGMQLHQTLTIARYLARTFDLMPEDLFQQARIEALVESFFESFIPLGACFRDR